MNESKKYFITESNFFRLTVGHFCIIFSIVISLMVFTIDVAMAECEDCNSLVNLTVDNGSGISYTNILSSSVESIDKKDGTRLKYCKVRGYVLPAINFEIRLPLKLWNKKFYMVGCGGFCGKVDTNRSENIFFNNINFGLVKNYAVATMDSGHWGKASSDARWAHNNRGKEEDWAYRAVHETAKVSMQVIEAFYCKKVKRSYFQGCSTGGRMAIKEALKFGTGKERIFDGMISGAPALNYTGLVGTTFAWMTQANYTAMGKEIITKEDVELIREAVYKKCKNKDNMLIEHPENCDFDPESLLCRGGNSKKCLSEIQVGSLKKIYQGPVNSKNELLFKGLPKSSEPYWWLWLNTQIPLYSENFLKYMAFKFDPHYDYKPKDFNFDSDPSKLRFMGDIYNATDTNLNHFFLNKGKSEGKIILWHGWADAMVPPWFTVEFYEEVSKKLKEQGKNPLNYIRLFMIPGLDHCGALCQKGSANINSPAILDVNFDPLTALDRWFDEDIAPESLLIRYRNNDGTISKDFKKIPYYKQNNRGDAV